MPCSDPEKQRESVRNARNKHYHTVEKLKKFENDDGELDVRKFLNANKAKLLNALLEGLDGKRTNSQLLKLVTQLTGDLTEKQEVKQTVEFTVADRHQLYTNVIAGLERERQGSGVCPLCHQRQALLNEPRLDSESE